MLQQCNRDFRQLPAWLQLEAIRQLEVKLDALDRTPHNAADIFAEILCSLKRNPPSELPLIPTSLHSPELTAVLASFPCAQLRPQ